MTDARYVPCESAHHMNDLVAYLSAKRRRATVPQHDTKFMHAAAIIDRNNMYRILAYGENHYKDDGTVHAEGHAIQRLLPLPRGRRLMDIDVLVIRCSKTGCLGNSKPCLLCVRNMTLQAPLKGYRVVNVYYSDQSPSADEQSMRIEKIVKTSLKNLQDDPSPHITMYYENAGIRNAS